MKSLVLLFYFIVLSLSAARLEQDNHKPSNYTSTNNCTIANVCSSGKYCKNGQCVCDNFPHDIASCEDDNYLLVLNCFCVTFNGHTNRTEVGSCLYNCERFQTGHGGDFYKAYPSNITELNKALCGKFNRRGSLCGSCKDGYYPLAYSYNMTCVRCEDTWYNWMEYLVVVYLPLTVFYFIILFFQVNMTSSYLLGFLVYSHFISVPMISRIMGLTFNYNNPFKGLLQFGWSIFSFWNLDFFRIFNQTTCLRHSILFLSVLELVSGVYPLFLILLTYTAVYLYDNNYRLVTIVMKPICALVRMLRVNFEIRTSLIDSFSTFFLLSGNKLFNIAFDLLAATITYTINQTGDIDADYTLYLDGELTYFRGEHIPYGVLALSVLFVSIFLPTLCFILYPLQATQKCLSLFPPRFQILVHIFVDTFQGSFKNGTESGTRDCRWFSLFHFVLRGMAFVMFFLCPTAMFLVYASIVLTLLSLSFIVFQPFKENGKHNLLTPIFILYLSCVFLGLEGGDMATYKQPVYEYFILAVTLAMALIPLIYVSILVVNPVFLLFKHHFFSC